MAEKMVALGRFGKVAGMLMLLWLLMLLVPAFGQVNGNCWQCELAFLNDPTRGYQCYFQQGDGTTLCYTDIYQCSSSGTGGPCCNASNKGKSCWTCNPSGEECKGDGQCGGSIGCPGTDCCANGYCYPSQSPQCQNIGLIKIANAKIRRPSEETWAAFPWITQANSIIHQVKDHSMNPDLLQVQLESAARLQLIHGVMPRIYQPLLVDGKGIFFKLITHSDADIQTITVSEFDGKPNVADLANGRQPSVLIETITFRKDSFTIVNAKGTFSGTLAGFVPAKDKPACGQKKPSLALSDK